MSCKRCRISDEETVVKETEVKETVQFKKVTLEQVQDVSFYELSLDAMDDRADDDVWQFVSLEDAIEFAAFRICEWNTFGGTDNPKTQEMFRSEIALAMEKNGVYNYGEAQRWTLAGVRAMRVKK